MSMIIYISSMHYIFPLVHVPKGKRIVLKLWQVISINDIAYEYFNTIMVITTRCGLHIFVQFHIPIYLMTRYFNIILTYLYSEYTTSPVLLTVSNAMHECPWIVQNNQLLINYFKEKLLNKYLSFSSFFFWPCILSRWKFCIVLRYTFKWVIIHYINL